MADPRGRRLRIGKGTIEDRARTALRHALGLSDGEIDRLARKLPAELELYPPEASQEERLIKSLGSAGLDARVTPTVVVHEPCEAHRRLAKGSICARCEQRTCYACRELGADGVCPPCLRTLRRRRLFRNVRIGLLLAVLAGVAVAAYRDRQAISSWERPIRVAIHPFGLEPDASIYATNLTVADFAAIDPFLVAQAARYGLARPSLVEVSVGETPDRLPPLPPPDPGVFDAMIFSLSLRLYTLTFEYGRHPAPADVRMFVLYANARPGRALEHSIGLQKGRVAIVHAFADDHVAPLNALVVTHELLHIAGASDKYEAGGYPMHPAGFAEPDRQPLLPQEAAEIMAGTIPKAESAARLARSLDECVVGWTTAREIGWAE
jgi:hypothetical protein